MHIHRWHPLVAVLGCLALLPAPATAAEQTAGHAHPPEAAAETHAHAGEHEEANRVHLTPEQIQAAGVQVQALAPRTLGVEIAAPGEIRLNIYATSEVTPRIKAQVVARHAHLGDAVRTGQPLVALSSVAMAGAQGKLLVAAKEWQRVRKLGRKVVSERRYVEARVAFQQAHARLLAFGLTEKQIDQLITAGNADLADGRFTLVAPQDGTVIRDDFIVGQMVEPGDLLFEITDESRLWVEAWIAPDEAAGIRRNAPARIKVGDRWIDGRIIQSHHTLDEATRTLAARIEIPNPDDLLHPGQFVTAFIQSGAAADEVLALPLDAVTRSPDGDWQVFVEADPGEFEPVEVRLVRQLPGLAVVEGLAPGTRTVIQGAFFVQSELAKSGFEIHQH